MIRIVIDNVIRIYGIDKCADKELVDEIKKCFTYVDPWSEEYETISTYEEDDDCITILRGGNKKLKNILKKLDYTYEIVDNRISLKPIDVQDVLLRSYQIDPFKIIISKKTGILEGPPGSGKTILGLAIIAAKKQPTLVLVHTSIIFKQWKDKIKEFLHYNCGVLGCGKWIVKDISVGMFQTLYSRFSNGRNEDIVKKFGCIIVDECHRISASTFRYVTNKFPAKYRYGLTATPYRKDKMDFIFFDTIGDVVAKIESSTKASIHVIKDNSFSFYYRDRRDWVSMISALTANTKRNLAIVKNIIKNTCDGHHILVLTERVIHCEMLEYILNTQSIGNIHTAVITSKVNEDERKRIKDDFLSGKINVVIGTIKLLAEGMDITNVDRIHIASPTNNEGLLVQIIGRGQRNIESKNLIIYDYEDVRCPALRSIVKYNHNKWYKNYGYTILDEKKVETKQKEFV